MIFLPFVHPVSREPLKREANGYRSPSGEFFPDGGNCPCFVPGTLRQHMEVERTGLINRLKCLLRRSPMLYRLLIFLISPVCFSGVSPQRFLDPYPQGSLLLNIGAGIHRYRKDLINLDIFPYEGVDVVADATALPIPDSTCDAILCEFLLEHVPDPAKVVSEILRVLKPGGRAYIAIPFVYPFHASPNDFHRWSIEGLRKLLKDGTIEDINTRSGPTSALTAQLVTWSAVALSFGSEALYSIFSLFFLLLFFPLKFLDLLFGWYPTSIHGAADFYAIVRKPPL